MIIPPIQLERTSLRTAVLFIWILFLALSCGGGQSGRGTVTLILGAYTTPREAYTKAILPQFKTYWKQKTGREVEFQESYQGSGAQSRAIISGFEADVAALSLEGDIDRIAQAGLIDHDWKASPYQGIVTTSVVVIATRPGNPLGLRDWNDLTRPGLKLVTPDPKTSGGAQWNIAAIYGAALRGYTDAAKDDPTSVRDFLKRVLGAVLIMDKGARESIMTFEKGVGDAAITYENEVLVGRMAGRRYEYSVPRSTILIENPVAVVDKYVDKHGVREAAEAFVQYLRSKDAQRIFARYGLRPVDPEVAAEPDVKFPGVEDLWKIDSLGGWKQAGGEIFGPQGVYTKIFEELHNEQ
jgi:sulfate/thiosulfate-binding protein